MASYYDGEPEQFDTQNVNEAKSGDLQTEYHDGFGQWRLGTAEAYGEIQEYLDVGNLIDYMMLNFTWAMMIGTVTIGMLGENVRWVPDISFLAGMLSLYFAPRQSSATTGFRYNP